MLVKMFTKALVNFFLVFLLTCNVVPAVYSEACTSSEGQAGECVLLADCPKLSNIINMSLPMTFEKDMNQIVKSICGFEGSSPKVCCPSATLNNSTNNEDPTVLSEFYGIQAPPDVTNHPNINLLPTNCGPVVHNKLSTYKAQVFEFPWVARLYYERGDTNRFLCTGSIISSRYILTAAHCFKNTANFKLIGVRLGDFNIDSNGGCEKFNKTILCPLVQDIEVEEFIPHPGYGRSLKDDIGLIRLKTEINFIEENTFPVCLPISSKLANMDLVSSKPVALSWDASKNSSDLDMILISVIDNHNCSEIYRRILAKGLSYKEFCGFRSYEPSENRQRLDSGSPLQKVTETESAARYIQYGINILGPKRASDTYPDVFTKVSYYMDWILDEMKP